MPRAPMRTKRGHAGRRTKRAANVETPEWRPCRGTGPARTQIVPLIPLGALPAQPASTWTATVDLPRPQVASPPESAAGSVIHISDLESADESIPCDSELDQSSFNSPAIPTPESQTPNTTHQEVMQAFLAVQPESTARSLQSSWLAKSDEPRHMSRVMRVSTLAFCGAKLGRAGAEASLVQASRQWYAIGLRELQGALYDPKQMHRDETLGACMLLAMYEISECPAQSRRGYSSHYEGCAMLVKSRGPEAHATGLARPMFTTFRVMGAMEGMIHKKTFLTDPEWMEKPFRQRPKTSFDKLVDMMLELPGLLALSDEVMARPKHEDRFAGGVEMLKTTVDLASRFCDYYTELESTAGPLYWANGTPKDPALRIGIPFPVQYAFPSIEMAGILLHFWASRTVILSVLWHLHQNMSPWKSVIRSYNGANNLAPGKVANWASVFNMPISDTLLAVKGAVRDVCQSVEFCLQCPGRWAGSNAIVGPLRVVLDTVGRWPEFQQETRWILRTLDRIHQQGMAIVPYLGQHPAGYK